MKYLIVLLLLFSLKSYAKVDCDTHKIFCQIKANNPELSNSYAMKLSNIIYRKAKELKFDSNIFTAILMQETGYNHTKKACKTGLRETTNKERHDFVMLCSKTEKYSGVPFSECAKNSPLYIRQKICTDFGIGQIWYKTIDRYKFDVQKITTDLEYSVHVAGTVFADISKRWKKKEKYYWTRYNATTPSKRENYRKLVKRYLRE